MAYREGKQERSNWRPGWLSQRHRKWGYRLGCVDLDFVVIEYGLSESGRKCHPRAFIEYKVIDAIAADSCGYNAITIAADATKVPFFEVRYQESEYTDCARYIVRAVNKLACDYAEDWRSVDDKTGKVVKRLDCNEIEFVTFLYDLRGEPMDQEVIDWLNQNRRGK